MGSLRYLIKMVLTTPEPKLRIGFGHWLILISLMVVIEITMLVIGWTKIRPQGPAGWWFYVLM